MTYQVFPLLELTYPLELGTIGATLAIGDELRVHCNTHGCHHHQRINLVALGKRLGPQHSTLDRDLRPYFYCSRCRAAGRPDRNIGFIRSALTDPHSKWPREGR